MPSIEQMQAASGPSRAVVAESTVADDGDAILDELDQYVKAETSVANPVLIRLKAMESRPLAAYNEARAGTYDSIEPDGPTELSWQGRRLLWRRGQSIIRSYTFDEEIVCACWTWMNQQGLSPVHPTNTARRARRVARQKQAPSLRFSSNAAFTSAQAAFMTSLSGNSKQPRLTESTDQGARSLVVVLLTSIRVYYPATGQEYIVPKHFRLRSTHPASCGMFFLRAAEAEEEGRSFWPADERQDASPPGVPMLFYLGHHLDEVTAVTKSDIRTPSYPSAFFDDAGEIIVFSSENPQILVTLQKRTSCICIYLYEINLGPHASNVARNGSVADAQRYTPPKVEKLDDLQARRADASRPSIRRLESSSMVLGKGAPPAQPRRSARLSGNMMTRDHNTAGATRPSLNRRRSSRHPGAADATKPMRVEEPHLQQVSLANAASAVAGTVPSDSKHFDEAAEAEEMGQIVEGMARRGHNSVGATRMSFGQVGEHPLEGLTRRTSTNYQRRTSQAARTPYTSRTPGSRSVSATMPRHSTQSATVLDDADEVDLMEEATRTTHEGNTALTDRRHPAIDRSSSKETSDSAAALLDNSRTSSLWLLDSVRIENTLEASGIQCFSIRDGGHEGATRLFIKGHSTLIVRDIKVDQGSRRPEVPRATCQIVSVPNESHLRSSVSMEHIFASGHQHGDLLSLSREGHLHLYIGAEMGEDPILLEPDLSSSSPWRSTQEPSAMSFTALSASETTPPVVGLRRSDGSSLALRLNLQPISPLVQAALSALDFVAATRMVRKRWCQAMIDTTQISEWRCLEDAMLRRETFSREQESSAFHTLLRSEAFERFPASMSDWLSEGTPVTVASDDSVTHGAEVLRALHDLAQDALFDVGHSETALPSLVGLLAQLENQDSQSAYRDFWCWRLPHMLDPGRSNTAVPLTPQAVDVFVTLISALIPQALQTKTTGQNLAAGALLPGARRIFNVFSAVRTSIGKRRHALVTTMLGEGLTLQALDRLPLSLSIALQQALKVCRDRVPAGLSAGGLLLIQRQDLARSLEAHTTIARRYSPEELRTLPGTCNLDPLSAMLFDRDFRLQDVADMLLTSRPIAIRAPTRQDKTDQENREVGMARLHNAAERIKATPIGRGMFLMLTRKYDPTQKWQTPRINLRILLRPAQPYGLSEPRPDAPELEWPDFHNGAASALEMVVKHTQVDSTWYFSQSAREHTARHAGLLLGLGLAGRFATIGQVHTYRYLGDRHNLTSIGLLLGLSATFVGKGDPDVRALLACHVKAFLPPNSANLSHSTLVQSAALLGTGLLFLGAGVSHIAEALCEQIGAQEIETTDSQRFCREAYCLSAALGVGLVMLGRGRRTTAISSRDKGMLAKLEHFMVGQTPALFDESAADPTWKVDERITTAAAALAYGLIFLRSNNRSAANRIRLPSNDAELVNVRPDILLILSLTRALIMWDDIEPSHDWIQSIVPRFLLQAAAQESSAESRQLAVLHLETGAAFALGLKFTGSANPAAKSLLLKRYRELDHLSKTQPKTSFSGRIMQSAARAAADVLLTALSIVLAGTGDVDVLKVLRMAHAHSPAHEPHGSHMASHMALGMLFLGGGRFSLSDSDASIASLLIAFYPRYPGRAQDNRAHLQAYRHLWMLAVEPRLIITQDVDTGGVVHLPLKIEAADSIGRRPEEGMSPYSLPHIQHIHAVSAKGDRYFDAKLDFHASEDLNRIRHTVRTLFVQKKPIAFDHASDSGGQKTAMRTALTTEIARVGAENGTLLHGHDSVSCDAVRSTGYPEIPQSLQLPPATKTSLEGSSVANMQQYLVEARMECLRRNDNSLLPLFSILLKMSSADLEHIDTMELQDVVRTPDFTTALLALIKEDGVEVDLHEVRRIIQPTLQGLRLKARQSLQQDDEVRDSIRNLIFGNAIHRAAELRSSAVRRKASNVLTLLRNIEIPELRALANLMRTQYRRNEHTISSIDDAKMLKETLIQAAEHSLDKIKSCDKATVDRSLLSLLLDD